MLCESLMWRKQNGVDRIHTTWRAPDVVIKYFPGGWLGAPSAGDVAALDKEGRPLYLLRLGQMDVKGLLRASGADDIEKLAVYLCEEGLEKYVAATASTGHPVRYTFMRTRVSISCFLLLFLYYQHIYLGHNRLSNTRT